ncbi:MAG TPA: beta-ketoacyl synthase N-terminal-like domain-containing protein, partial [Kofleriaceae bacterium]
MNTPIAIVGIGCRFPGASNDPEELWRLLTHGVDAIREIPADRWSLRSYYHADPARPGRTYARWGGFLDCVDQFDAAFFSMSPREAAKADPQQRLLLEVAYEALEDSGQTIEGISGKRGGVFVGISSFDYAGIQCSRYERDSIDAYMNHGSALSIAANRISYFFNLHGPSFAVDTACSSALVAVHLACQSMWSGEIELAFVGGVNLMLRPEPTIGFSKASMLAPDGRCKSFDAAADGYARAEGAGIVLLKPLPKAQADGDSIYAVIRSTAANQDGRTGGIAVPSADAQQAMLREALDHAGIAAQSVQYVEAHGTGTPVGDPIEAAAIGAVYGAPRPPGQECLIGTIKSNFGHPEAASGAAGLIKAALAVQRGAIPATLHQVNPNPHIPFDDLKLRVVNELTPWPDTGGEARRAAVNSFGFGGTNAHVILESAPAVEPRRSPPADGTGIARPMLLPISARSPEALRAAAATYAQFLQDDTRAGASLADICHTAAVRRSHHDHRLAVVAHTTAEFCDLLRGFLAGESSSMCHAGRQSSKHGVAFVCSGMGQQWWAMGRQLLAEERGYRDVVGHIDEILRALAGWSLLREFEADEQHTRINETRVAQPAIFATQVGIAAVLKQWGIQPSALVGHSVGEVAAAYLAGALSLEDAVKVTYHRSRLQQRTAGLGTMLAAGVSWQEAHRLINGYDAVVSVGAINSAESVTLSGDSEVLRAIAQELDAKGVFCRALNVEVPYHSPTMDTLRSELLDSLGDLRPRATSVPLYSTVTGGLIDGTTLTATYWWQNVRQPVQFHQATSSAIEAGHDVFMEIGAHPVLSVSIAECLREHDRKGVVVPSLRRGQPENATLLASAGRLYTLGATIDWHGVTRSEGTFVKLPTYPWQRERHWHESDRARRERLGEVVHPLLGMRSESAEPRWLVELDLASLPFLSDHRAQGATIFPAAGYVEMGLAVGHELLGAAPCVVEDLEFRKALFLSDNAPSTIEVAVQRSSHTFEVSTLTPGSDIWTGHAGGKVRALPAAALRKPLDLDAIRARCPNAISGKECYRRFQALGLEYGPAFQPIAQLWRGADEAIAELHPRNVGDDQDEFWLDPALLDGLFQVSLGTLAERQETGLYLPVRIDRVEYHAPPGARTFGYARVRERNGAESTGDLVLTDEQGVRLVEVRGFTCRFMETGKETSNWPVYQYQWRLKTRVTKRPADVRSAAHLPRPSELEPVLAAEAAVLRQRWRRDKFHGERGRLLCDMAVAYIFEAFTELGWDPVRDAAIPVAALAEQLGVVPEHRRLFARLLEGLTSEDISAAPGVLGPSRRRAIDVWRQIWRQYPDAMPELTLISSCGGHLAGVLRGDVNPLEVIFPEGSSVTAEHLYQDSPVYRVYNQLIQKALSEIVQRLPEGRTLRVLEIGGGTGGLSAFVLPKLPPLRTQYTFTDIGATLVSQAERNFSHYPFIEYRTLDIDANPVEQGFSPHVYDIIVASDVLHATRNLGRTVGHVAQLLASEGTLLLLEPENPELAMTLAFGMLEGWRQSADTELRWDEPLITHGAWRRLLAKSGFEESVVITDAPTEEQARHAVIVARGPSVDATSSMTVRDRRASWLVFADRAPDGLGTGESVAASLRRCGQDVVMAYAGTTFRQREDGAFVVAPGTPADIDRLFDALPCNVSELAGIVHLWSLEAPSSDEADGDGMERAWRVGLMSGLQLAQALGARAGSLPPLWLVTRGAQAVGGDPLASSVAQSVLWGLGVTVVNECPQFRTHLVDLGTGGPEEIRSLVDELLDEDDEDQIALRGDARYIRRLLHLPKADGAPVIARAATPRPDFRIEAMIPGILDTLGPREVIRRPPGPGEVQIEVVAAALNFKDVMMAMALLPPEATRGGYSLGMLGLECSGRITAVGDG